MLKRIQKHLKTKLCTSFYFLILKLYLLIRKRHKFCSIRFIHKQGQNFKAVKTKQIVLMLKEYVIFLSFDLLIGCILFYTYNIMMLCRKTYSKYFICCSNNFVVNIDERFSVVVVIFFMHKMTFSWSKIIYGTMYLHNNVSR